MKKNNLPLIVLSLFAVVTLALGSPSLVAAQLQPQADSNNGLWAVNSYRALAGVAPVLGDPTLTDQCMRHAAYMAQNQVASLSEDKTSTTYSAEGDLCAGKALIYFLPENPQHLEALRTVDAWMESPTHRMWMLYPTLAVTGFGYKTNAVGQNWVTTSTMDVLSGIDFVADSVYPNWPARYPAPGQIGVPSTRMAITTWWPYAGPVPSVNLSNTTLKTSSGETVPFSIKHDPADYGGHKHITLIPNAPLAYDTIYVVHLEGTYDGDYFTYEWKFSTGTTAIPE